MDLQRFFPIDSPWSLTGSLLDLSFELRIPIRIEHGKTVRPASRNFATADGNVIARLFSAHCLKRDTKNKATAKRTTREFHWNNSKSIGISLAECQKRSFLSLCPSLFSLLLLPHHPPKFTAVLSYKTSDNSMDGYKEQKAFWPKVRV